MWTYANCSADRWLRFWDTKDVIWRRSVHSNTKKMRKFEQEVEKWSRSINTSKMRNKSRVQSEAEARVELWLDAETIQAKPDWRFGQRWAKPWSIKMSLSITTQPTDCTLRPREPSFASIFCCTGIYWFYLLFDKSKFPKKCLKCTDKLSLFQLPSFSVREGSQN